MRTRLLSRAALALAFAAAAAAQTAPTGRIAILQVQDGVLNTREGHQAFTALDAKFASRKAELEKMQTEIASLNEQLRKGSSTLSDDAQRKLARDIEKKTKAYNYQFEATQSDYTQEQSDLFQTYAQKFRTVTEKYGKDNGIGLIIDVSNPQTPAFWWASAMDITNDVVRAYDAAHPAPAGATPAASPAPPAQKKK